jgi:hypothetical protein
MMVTSAPLRQAHEARLQTGRRLARRRADQRRLAAPLGRRRRQEPAPAKAGGPRLYDWAYLPHHGAVAPGWQKGLLIPGSRVEGIPGQDRDRRKINKPQEFTFYLTLAPVATTLAELVRVAGMRWTIQACFEAAKGEVGLDEYEVRSWTGWHRHITLAMLAHAYLAVLRQAAAGGKISPASRHRSRLAAGSATPHRARTAPAAVAAGLGTSARSRARSRLVGVAAPAPAARPPQPLEAADPLQ